MNEIFDLSNMAQVSSAQVDNIVKRLRFNYMKLPTYLLKKFKYRHHIQIGCALDL